MSKLSGPLLDRIDLHLEVPAVPFEELASKQAGTSSQEMREQVVAARVIQARRFAGSHVNFNAQMSSRMIREFCPIDSSSRELLKASVNDLGLSARAHDKILRVSRTLADLEGEEKIQVHHVSEAINYRMLDRQMWT